MANLRLSEGHEEVEAVDEPKPGQVGFEDVASYLSREYGVADNQLFRFIAATRKANGGSKRGRK